VRAGDDDRDQHLVTTINPLSVKFTTTAQLAGAELSAFRAKLAQYKGLHVGEQDRFAQKALGPVTSGK